MCSKYEKMQYFPIIWYYFPFQMIYCVYSVCERLSILLIIC